MKKTKILLWALAAFCLFTLATNVFAGEADIKIPSLDTVKFAGLGGISGSALMYLGILPVLRRRPVRPGAIQADQGFARA